jgi:hypothetical protein
MSDEPTAAAVLADIAKRLSEHYETCGWNRPVCNCKDIALLASAARLLRQNKEGLEWALCFVEKELRSQHRRADDPFDTCPCSDCVKYRAFKAVAVAPSADDSTRKDA